MIPDLLLARAYKAANREFLEARQDLRDWVLLCALMAGALRH